MERLAHLSKALGYPSVGKLFAASQAEGLRLTYKQIQQFTAGQNVRQVFHKLPPSNGKITAQNIDDTWVADLIDYTAHPSFPNKEPAKQPFQYVLIVQDIFTRKVFGEALRDKQPETVKNAF